MDQLFGHTSRTLDTDAGGLRLTAPDGRALPDLPGHHLEAAFGDDQHQLFFVTHDILHEEQLDICLVAQGQLLDRLSLGQMFQPAQLSDLTQAAPRTFTFRFPQDQSWHLDVFAALQFALPDLRHMVSRARMFQSVFKLKRSVSP